MSVLVRGQAATLRRSYIFYALLLGTIGVAVVTNFNSAYAGPRKSAALVVDAKTGKILHSEFADAKRYPASLTKMMTLYMVFDLIDRGRLSYNDKITISSNAASAPPSKLGLKAGSKISVRNAAKALVVKSANDIAVAIAEHIGGTHANFARLMTRKARQIGMKKTTFRNASGLPNKAQVSTARDMITLALRLQDEFPNHYKIFKTRHFKYRGKRYRNYNTLLGRFQGTDGIKTGYTRASGFNLVSSVRQRGRHVVAAVFGGRTAGRRNAKMRALLKKGLAKASRRMTRRKYPRLIARAKPAKRARRKIVKRKRTTQPRPVKKTAAIKQVRAKNKKLQLANVRKIQTIRIEPPPPVPPRLKAERRVTQTNSALSRTRSVTSQALADLTSPTEASDATRLSGKPRGAQSGTPSTKASTRGRTPSTLQQQLAELERRERRFAQQSRANETRTPYQAGSMANLGDYIIQIGAFRSQSEANNRLAAVSRSARGLLTGYTPRTERILSRSGALYRARFAGFDSDSAGRTCTELRRRGVDCFVQKSAALR